MDEAYVYDPNGSGLNSQESSPLLDAGSNVLDV